jgi:hypothetical protein
MTATATKHDWRRSPLPGHHYMTQPDYDWEPTIIPASESYAKDKARLRWALDCEFTEVRMATEYKVWDPETAEAEWRSENCECEDGPHWTAPSYNADGEVTKPPEECATTKAAESVEDFWDEGGYYCPWVTVDRKHPDAVKFRRGSIAGGSR